MPIPRRVRGATSEGKMGPARQRTTGARLRWKPNRMCVSRRMQRVQVAAGWDGRGSAREEGAAAVWTRGNTGVQVPGEGQRRSGPRTHRGDGAEERACLAPAQGWAMYACSACRGRHGRAGGGRATHGVVDSGHAGRRERQRPCACAEAAAEERCGSRRPRCDVDGSNGAAEGPARV
jgi:hypothetical protein